MCVYIYIHILSYHNSKRSIVDSYDNGLAGTVRCSLDLVEQRKMANVGGGSI